MPTKPSVQELFKRAVEANPDLASLGANAYLFFVLSASRSGRGRSRLAALALTDGPDDKKVDACYIDLEEAAQ